MYSRIEEMYGSITWENSRDWGLCRVHCRSKRRSYKLLWCCSANPHRVPLAAHLIPEGMAVLMISDVPCFSPACLFLLFSAVSTASYSELGQLSDARWPNSARPCPSSLEEGMWGKPFHCTAAAAQQLCRGTAGTADTKAVAPFNNLLVSGLQSNYFKKAALLSHLSILHPSPDLFFFLHVLIKLPRTESARVHSKSIWPTVIVFFLPLIISSISLCSWYDWSLKLFVANSFLHSLSWYFSDCSDHCNPTYLQLGCWKHRQILPLVLPKNLMKGRNENLALIECFFKFLTIYD